MRPLTLMIVLYDKSCYEYNYLYLTLVSVSDLMMMFYDLSREYHHHWVTAASQSAPDIIVCLGVSLLPTITRLYNTIVLYNKIEEIINPLFLSKQKMLNLNTRKSVKIFYFKFVGMTGWWCLVGKLQLYQEGGTCLNINSESNSMLSTLLPHPCPPGS